MKFPKSCIHIGQPTALPWVKPWTAKTPSLPVNSNNGARSGSITYLKRLFNKQEHGNRIQTWNRRVNIAIACCSHYIEEFQHLCISMRCPVVSVVYTAIYTKSDP
ncbi:hypothetical protein BDA96_06G297000 [Sorghum bicolor]|nr:hypothetical protein BDA96_06G297000 [Sorghum bicolor]